MQSAAVVDIRAEIQTMLAESPERGAEEHAIHDYDNFAGIRLGEYEDLATVAELAQLVAEHGELARAAYDHAGSAWTPGASSRSSTKAAGPVWRIGRNPSSTTPAN